jgi:hypothetical protein
MGTAATRAMAVVGLLKSIPRCEPAMIEVAIKYRFGVVSSDVQQFYQSGLKMIVIHHVLIRCVLLASSIANIENIDRRL